MLVAHREVVPLVAGQQTYTVGAGGDVDVDPAPMTVDAASYVTDAPSATETFLAVATRPGRDRRGAEDADGVAAAGAALHARRAAGELWVWPVPTVAQDVVLYWREPLAQFPDLDDRGGSGAGLRQGAADCNLAIELAPEFGRAVDPTVERLARESLADMKRVNFPLVEIGIDPALTGGARLRHPDGWLMARWRTDAAARPRSRCGRSSAGARLVSGRVRRQPPRAAAAEELCWIMLSTWSRARPWARATTRRIAGCARGELLAAVPFGGMRVAHRTRARGAPGAAFFSRVDDAVAKLLPAKGAHPNKVASHAEVERERGGVGVPARCRSFSRRRGTRR